MANAIGVSPTVLSRFSYRLAQLHQRIDVHRIAKHSAGCHSRARGDHSGCRGYRLANIQVILIHLHARRARGSAGSRARPLPRGAPPGLPGADRLLPGVRRRHAQLDRAGRRGRGIDLDLVARSIRAHRLVVLGSTARVTPGPKRRTPESVGSDSGVLDFLTYWGWTESNRRPAECHFCRVADFPREFVDC
jgi:hypothetical protein